METKPHPLHPIIDHPRFLSRALVVGGLVFLGSALAVGEWPLLSFAVAYFTLAGYWFRKGC